MVRYVVPTAVILLLGAVVAVGIGRAVFTAEVGTGFICQAPGDKKSVPVSTTPEHAGTFNAADICWWSGLSVEKGRRYIIGIEMEDPWFDRTIFASPYGFDGAIPALAVPLRRWTGAKWFQPVVKIGSEDTFEQVLAPIDGALPDTETKPADIDDSALGWFEPISKLPPQHVAAARAQWSARKPQRVRFVAEFTAESTGDLFLYVNDAVNIFWVGGGYGLFYKNNTGTAKVWLQQKQLPAMPPEKPPQQAAR